MNKKPPPPTFTAAGIPPQELRRALDLLPSVLELIETSPLHFLLPVRVVFDHIFPALINGQFRLLMRAGKPAAFVNWAFLSPEVSERYARGDYILAQHEWSCGPELWFCEIIVRDGMLPHLMYDLQHHVFPQGAAARWLRVGPSGEAHGMGRVRIPRLRHAAPDG